MKDLRLQSRFTIWLSITLVTAMCTACNKPPQDFHIKFPDAEFVVPRDWVPSNVRAEATTEFEIRIPRNQVGKDAMALVDEMRSIDAGSTYQSGDFSTFNLRVFYADTPRPGAEFMRLKALPHWRFLPDTTDAVYRVAVQDSPLPNGPWRSEMYELKADPRYVISCGIYRDGRDLTKAFGRCSLAVPYKEFSGDKCTQLIIGFPQGALSRWRDIAHSRISVLRPLESNSTRTK